MGRGAAVEAGVVGPRGDGEIGRASGSEDDQLALGIRHQAVGHVGLGTAQVGGVHAGRGPGGSGVVLDDGHVHRPVEAGVERAHTGGVAGLEHRAGRVEITLCIVGRGVAPVIGCSAAKGGEHHRGVDDQLTRRVVSPQAKAHRTTGHLEGAGHGLPLPGGVGLPGAGGQLGHGAHAGGDAQVARGVEGEAGGALVAQGDGGGLTAGLHRERVLKLLRGIFVEPQADAGVHCWVGHGAEAGNIAGPPGGVVAAEVVAAAGRGLLTHRLGV